jgi:hypothetical protein
MNLDAPRARMLIRRQTPCRWRSNDHLLRCQSVLRAHVRPSTLRAQGLLASPPERISQFSLRARGARRVPPCIWPSLNRLHHPNTRTDS